MLQLNLTGSIRQISGHACALSDYRWTKHEPVVLTPKQGPLSLSTKVVNDPIQYLLSRVGVFRMRVKRGPQEAGAVVSA